MTMAYLFDALEFPDASRMTDLWNNTWADEAVGAEIATGHLVELGVDQHVDVESDFLNSHMPFHVAGFGGLYPDGRPWMFTMQTAPADLAVRLLGGADPHRILGDSLTRALDFNPEARLVDALAWTRHDLVEVYADEGNRPRRSRPVERGGPAAGPARAVHVRPARRHCVGLPGLRISGRRACVRGRRLR
ncbi:hypothetical protein ACWPOB_20560 [Rhodococcus sp. 2H158]